MSEDLFKAALAVRDRAHAPYSGFKVGAALRAESGAVHAGANVENVSYPEGWCAETSAIARMVAEGDRAITEIVIVADSDPPVTPCGGCRQRIAEFAGPDIPVHAADLGCIRKTYRLGDLLPAAFEFETEKK